MKHSIRVSLQPVAVSDLFPVRLRVAWSGCRCDLSLGVSYNREKWLSEIGRARPNTRNTAKQSATEVNGLIEDAVRWVDAWFVKCEVSGAALSAKDLKTAFDSEFRQKGSGVKSCDLLSAFDRFFLETAREKGWTDNTCSKYKSIKNILVEYGVSAANFDEAFLREYVQREIAKGHKNASIAKIVRLLKFFARYCLENGVIKEDLSKFSPHLRWSGGNTKAVVYLEFSEVEKIISADGLPDSLSLVRDMFVFSCFSGLRFSDIVKLRKIDVKNGKIYTVTQKTSDALEIELNHFTRAIFDKYKDNSFGGDFLFPRISNQLANRDLKIIFRMLGLARPIKKISFSGSERVETVLPLCDVISFHAGRRTFVVECLRRGISPSVVMKWTGHSDYSAMRPYIEIVDSLKISEMAKFDV